MTANLHNFTDRSVTLGTQTLPPVSSQRLVCGGTLPAPIPDGFILVPACMAAAAGSRPDVVWSPAIANCGDCAPPPSKRSWFAQLTAKQPLSDTLMTVEHYTPDDGRQSIGVDFFRRRYLD